jgi:hypothetical protein
MGVEEKMYLGRVSDTEAIRWIENIYAWQKKTGWGICRASPCKIVQIERSKRIPWKFGPWFFQPGKQIYALWKLAMKLWDAIHIWKEVNYFKIKPTWQLSVIPL